MELTTEIMTHCMETVADRTALVITTAAREQSWQDAAAGKPAVLVLTAADIITRVANIPTGSAIVLDELPASEQAALAPILREAATDLLLLAGPPQLHPKQLAARIRDRGPRDPELVYRLSPEGRAATYAGAIAELMEEL